MVVGTGELADAAGQEVASVVAGVHRVPSLAELDGWAPEPSRWVALVVLLDHEDGAEVDEVVHSLLGMPAFGDARLLVVTTRTSLTGMSRSVDAGHIDGVVAAPWTPGNLARYADAQVARATLLAGRSGSWEQHDSALLRRLAMGTEAAAVELLEVLESVLGPRPRVHLDKGVRITVPEERLNQVFLVVKGRVELTVTSPAGEVVLHHASTGPLVGLLALTEMQHSTVTARTTTRCEMVSLTLEQLDFALTRDPRVATSLMALTMRALSTRLRRSEQLHIKNATLSAELRSTLDELRAARAGLVEQARMATLGELAAGVAHELNNPAATVTRGVDHLSADLRRLLGRLDEDGGRGDRVERRWGRRGRGGEDPLRAAGGGTTGGGATGGGAVLEALVSAEERDHVSAREERALRRALAAEVSDPSMVRRLVAAGVRDPRRARELVDGPPELLARVEAAAGIGATLRAVRVAGRHIATLVSALHSHARPDPAGDDVLREPTEVAETVQDALRLLEHRLRAVSVEVAVAPGLPPVASGPGLLTQVWTNLLANASDALTREGREEAGRITLRVGPGGTGSASAEGAWAEGAPAEGAWAEGAPAEGAPAGSSHLGPPGAAYRARVVRVEVEDDGPGVPEALREQIFTPRFTTKHGVVRYGLGLGLGIARSIVDRHGGRILLESHPGRTVFTVDLPAVGSAPLTTALPGTEGVGQGGPTMEEDR